ncbi:MAG: DUF2207 domain-containing protein [Chloroflexota bacterium]
MKARRYAPLVCLFILLLVVLGATGSTGHAHGPGSTALQGSDPVIYTRYDVDIDVREDGTVHVREEQEITFNDSFRTAFAQIPRDYVSEIRNVQLSGSEGLYELTPGRAAQAGEFSVSYEPDAIYVDWAYEATQAGDTRTFILEYDVVGGLWVYEDGDILEWRAVPSDRNGVPVRSSTVTVTLPQPLDADEVQVTAFGPGYTTEVQEQQVTFEATEEIVDGTAFQIMVGFPHGLVAAQVQPWQRAEDSAELVYRVPQLEIELEIDADGIVDVVERQTVAVEAGMLYEGRRVIPLAYVDGISGLSVYEGQQVMTFVEDPDPECEYCASIRETPASSDWATVSPISGSMSIDEEAAGEAIIQWAVPPLVSGEETTFVLQYTAVGVLQVREEQQVLAWAPAADFGVPVEDARVLLTLPDGVAPEDVEIEGAGAQRDEQGRLLLEHDGPVPAGDSWQIRVVLPPQATAAQPPLWQQELDEMVARSEAIREEIRQAEIRRARQQLAFAVSGGLLLVGGLLVVGLLWYFEGRDRPPGVVPATLAQPPSDLPPGIVAYLLDEKPTPKGVLASLFHLATLGLLRIRLEEPILLSRNWDEPLEEGQRIETPAGDTVSVPPHMVQLFNGLLPLLDKNTVLPDEEAVPLDALASQLTQLMPQVYYEMGEEANRFFDQAPQETRHRWLVTGQWVVLGGVGVAIAAAIFRAPQLGWAALAPAAALAIVGLGLVLVSRWMPRRSDAGAEEAARWRAFENYLRQLKRYGDENAAQQILDRYFAYAVALDVEDVLLQQAAEMGGRLPTWTRPVIISRPRPQPAAGTEREPTPPGPLRGRSASESTAKVAPRREGGGAIDEQPAPLLEGLSQSLSQRLQQANNSLVRTLNTAVGQVSETPFQLVWRGAKGAGKFTWDATTTSLEIMDDILDAASSGGGSSSYRGPSGGSRSSSRSSWGSSRSSSISRSSSSRRSGGGGSRGFGR